MLTVEEGKDYIIEDREQLPYQILGNLGHGNSGNVEKIRDINTGAIFACKTIRIYGARLRDSRRKIFDNEIKIIRSLTGHRHVIRVFATYVSNREVGLILQPVADEGDLEDFLGKYSEYCRELRATGNFEPDPRYKRMTSIIEQAFGCLLGGLAFMHQQKIRHKDIKPRNILIHEGNVIYTDFGYSLDSTKLGHSTTSGKPDFMTRRYSAPEVVDHEKRNSLSDVFSLGCVFLDLLAVLMPFNIYPEEQYFFDVMTSIFEQLRSYTPEPRLLFLIDLIYLMTAHDPSHRSTAFQASSIVLQHPEFSCDNCRLKFDKSLNLDKIIASMKLQDDSSKPPQTEEATAAEKMETVNQALALDHTTLGDVKEKEKATENEERRYVREDEFKKAPIKFKDAVGRKFMFPWHLVRTWTGMEQMIKNAFLHVDVLGPHVHEGHYDLVGPDGEIILPQVWDLVVQPDWMITMHMWPMPEPPPISSLPPPPPPAPVVITTLNNRKSKGKRRDSRNLPPSEQKGSLSFPPPLPNQKDIPPPPPPPLSDIGSLRVNITNTKSSKKAAPSPFMRWAAGGTLRSQPAKRTKKT